MFASSCRRILKIFTWVVALLLGQSAYASFHLWRIAEIYSNANGTVQYIELATSVAGQQFVSGHQVSTSQNGTTHSFILPDDLPGNSINHKFLIGTQSFASLGIVTPDYVVPDGFLFQPNGSVNFSGVDIMTYSALPTNGVNALDRAGNIVVNAPTNFQGATGTVGAPQVPPQCTLTAIPAVITAGASSTLIPSCSPTATSYAWTGGTCNGTKAPTCMVTPITTTSYSVAGINGSGTGVGALATVTVNAQIFQTISFANPGAQTLGAAPFALSATGGASGNPVTFTSQTTGICTVSGNFVTLLALGTCIIAANQAGNAAYSAAPQLAQSISVSAAPSQQLAAGQYDGIYLWSPGYFLSVHQDGGTLIGSIYWVYTANSEQVGRRAISEVDTFDLLNGPIVGSNATLTGTRFYRACTLSYDLTFNSDSTLTVHHNSVINSPGVSLADVDCAATFNSVGSVSTISKLF
jgi:hypothetical protein